MLFLENYHPCHNEDFQKKKKRKKEKKEIKRIFDLGGVLAGAVLHWSQGVQMNPLTRKKKKNLHI